MKKSIIALIITGALLIGGLVGFFGYKGYDSIKNDEETSDKNERYLFPEYDNDDFGLIIQNGLSRAFVLEETDRDELADLLKSVKVRGDAVDKDTLEAVYGDHISYIVDCPNGVPVRFSVYIPAEDSDTGYVWYNGKCYESACDFEILSNISKLGSDLRDEFNKR